MHNSVATELMIMADGYTVDVDDSKSGRDDSGVIYGSAATLPPSIVTFITAPSSRMIQYINPLQ